MTSGGYASRWFGFALLFAVAPLLLHAQLGGSVPGGAPQSGQTAPSQPANQSLVFRGGVTVVQIDAFVTDGQGNPVTDLTQEDFEVLERGAPRTISNFASVNLPIEPPVGLPHEDDVEPDVVTNATPPVRTYLFAIDEVSPDRALKTRTLIRQFIDKHLGANDVAAVALTGRGLPSSGQDFTSNRRLLLRAVEKITGGFGSSPGQTEQSPARLFELDPLNPNVRFEKALLDAPQTSDARQLASGLRRLTEFLAAMPGRKTLVYVGEGLSHIDINQLLSYRATTLSPTEHDAHAAIAAATRGNVTIYPLDPRGLTTALTPPGAGITDAENLEIAHRSDLAALADATGGYLFSNTNDFTRAFQQIVRESSVYYTIGFNSELKNRDGRFVPVLVRVKRPGLHVRSRDGYVAPLGPDERPAPVAGGARSPAVADAIASAVATGGVPLRVTATPYRKGREAVVSLAIEMGVSTLGLEQKNDELTGAVELSFLATNDRGTIVPGRRHSATLSLKGDGGRRAFGDGVRILSEFDLPPGRYQLRLAAGSTAAAGSVVYDLDVPDFSKEPLALSGISLTSTSASQMATLRLSDPLANVLPGPPVAVREFARTEVLTAFVNVYDNRPAGNAPTPIEVTTELRDDEGRAVASTSEQRTASSPTRGSGGHGITARFALTDVPAGRYILRVRADAEGAGPVTRAIPIVIK